MNNAALLIQLSNLAWVSLAIGVIILWIVLAARTIISTYFREKRAHLKALLENEDSK